MASWSVNKSDGAVIRKESQYSIFKTIMILFIYNKVNKYWTFLCQKHLFMCLLAFWGTFIQAQGKMPIGLLDMDYFGPETYQAHSQNWMVKQHPDGAIYVANSQGILEFDGERWQLLSAANMMFVRGFAFDGPRIYLGMQNDFGYFERDSSGHWQFYSLKSLLDLNSNDVQQIERVNINPTGVYFLGSHHLYRYHKQKLSRIKLEKTRTITAISWLDKHLLLGDLNGKLYQYDPLSNQIKDYLFDTNLANQYIYQFTPLDNQRILIVTKGGLFTLANGKVTQFTTDIDGWIKKYTLKRAILLDNGHYALASGTGGIAIIDERGILQRFITQSSGLKHSRVTDLFLDNQSGLWATHDGGISRIALNTGLNRFDQSIGTVNVEAIVSFQNTLYVGSRTNGLFELMANEKEGQESKFHQTNLKQADTWSLTATSDELFIGRSRGLDIAIKTPEGLVVKQRLLENEHIRTLTKLNQTTIIAVLGDGVARLIKTGNRWHATKLDLKVNAVNAIFQAPDTLWLDGISQSVVRLQQLEQWPNVEVTRFGPSDGVPKEPGVFKVNQQPFFATHEGIFKFEVNRTPPFYSDPLFNDFAEGEQPKEVWLVLQANNGTLYMLQNREFGMAKLTNNGDYQWQKSPFKLPGSLLNVIYVADSALWIGGDRGLYVIDTAIFEKATIRPRIILQRLDTDMHQSVYLKSAYLKSTYLKSTYLKSHHAYTGTKKIRSDSIVVFSDTQKINITMALTELKEAENNQYRWRLNDSSAWSEWQKEGRASFERLSSGNYRIAFQGKNSRSVVSEIVYLNFEIDAPWYETFWFRLFIFTCFTSLLILVVRFFVNYRTVQLEKQEISLRKKIEEATGYAKRDAAIIDAQNKKLDLQNKKLIDTNSRDKQFVLSLAHALRTPLAIIDGAHSLINGRSVDTLISGQLKRAQGATNELARKVDLLLTRAKFDTDDLDIPAINVNFSNIVEDITEQFQTLVEARSQYLSAKVVSDVVVYGDPYAFGEIIANLLSNASKYNKPNGTIELSLTYDDNNAILVVKDTGIGISKEKLGRITKQWVQEANANTNSSGLGMAAVQSIVDYYKGKLIIKSDLGFGSEFTVLLPRSKDPQPNATSHVSIDLINRELTHAKTILDNEILAKKVYKVPDNLSQTQEFILLVEDHPELANQLAQALREKNYTTITARNGMHALDIMKNYQPSIIISDVMMPEMDGFELVRRVKSSHPHIPIILITANNDDITKIEGLQFGADDYLIKPVNSDELCLRVRNRLNHTKIIRQQIATQPVYGKKRITVPLSPNGEKKANEYRDKIITWMESVFPEDPKVHNAAELFGFSNSDTFTKNFYSIMGVNPRKYIAQYKLEKAKSLLTETDQELVYIATDCGFSSQPHLTRAFKSQYKLTPNKYRETNKAIEV